MRVLYFIGIFGKAGEIQTNLCLAFGPNDVTYSGTLSGEIYKWKGQNLAGSISTAHTVCKLKIFVALLYWIVWHMAGNLNAIEP